MQKHKNLALFGLLLAPAALTGCYKTMNTHGQVLYPSLLEQVRPGVSTKQDVMSLLGTPSTTGTMNDNRWYYITTSTVTKPLEPNILQTRDVLIVDFDPSSSMVTNLTQKSAADAKDIDPVETQTPTYGQKMGVVDQIFSNLGFGKH